MSLRSRLAAFESLATDVLGTRLAVALARRWRRGGAAVLVYHRVRSPTLWDHPHQVLSPERFGAHVALLAAHAEIVPVAAAEPGGSRPRVAITFDDGYRELLANALPALADHGAASTVFCCSDVALGGAALWWDELEAAVRQAPRGTYDVPGGAIAITDAGSRLAAFVALRERCAVAAEPLADARAMLARLPAAKVDAELYLRGDELEQAERLGASIGSHAASHARLAVLAPDHLAAELGGSRSALEAAVGHAVDTVAYPYGDPSSVGERVIAAARAAGYRTGLVVHTSLVRPEADRLALPRVTAYVSDRPRRLAAKALGGAPGVYDWVRRHAC